MPKDQERDDWSRAGFDHEQRGELDRPLQTVAWDIPRDIGLNATGELLVWRWGWPAKDFRSPSAGMLEGFCKLDKAKPERIAAYARRWGPLRLKGQQIRLDRGPTMPGGEPERERGVRKWEGESLNLWRSLARQVRAILNIAAALRQDQRGSDQDWQILFDDGDSWPRLEEDSIEQERIILASQVDRWLSGGGIRPKFYWHPGQSPRLHLQPYGLYGALGLMLAATISGVQGIALCIGCKEFYTPEPRSPKQGQQNFCPDCRRKDVPGKFASAAYRQRKRNRATTGQTGTRGH